MSAIRRAARTDRRPPVAARTHVTGEPTMCERCGAVYERKTWRAADRAPTGAYRLRLGLWHHPFLDRHRGLFLHSFAGGVLDRLRDGFGAVREGGHADQFTKFIKA